MGLTTTHVTTVLDSDVLQVDGAHTTTTASIDDNTYVFVSGFDWLSVFALDAGGHLILVDNNSTAPVDLETIAVGDHTFLVSQSPLLTRVMLVSSDGTLLTVASEAEGGTNLWGASATFAFGDTAYLMNLSVVPGANNVLDTFLIDSGDGSLTELGSEAIPDSDRTLPGHVDMVTAVVDGSAYVFTALSRTVFDFLGGPDKIVVHELAPDGTLSLRDSVEDDTDNALEGLNGLATARIGLSTYLFAVSSTESAVTVFAVDSNGDLSEVDRATDSTVAALVTPQAIEVLEVNEVVYLSVAASTGIILFRVADDGSLTFIADVDDTVSDQPFSFFSGQDLTATEVDGVPFLTYAYTYETYADDSYSTLVSSESGVAVFELAHDVIDETAATPSVTEGLTRVTTIATIVDGDPVAFSITGGADADLFEIDADTGDVSFKTAMDFEAPGDADSDGTYEVEVTADDGIISETKSLSVSVSDYLFVNGESEAFSVVEGGTAVTTLTLVRGNGPLPVGFERLEITGGPDADLFAVNGNNRQLSFIGAPDYEAPSDADGDNVYEIEVTARDFVGSLISAVAVSETITVFVTVEDTLIKTGTEAVEVAENSTDVTTIAIDETGGPASFSITGGADAGLFVVDPTTGAVSFAAAPDFEAPSDSDGNNVYDVVIAADNGTIAETQTLEVSIANVAGPTIRGTKQGETLTGTGEEDTILGRNGNDNLEGFAGGDLLDGGKHKDTLSGGDDADQFRFSTKLKDKWADKITDFEVGIDTILLDKSVFKKVGPVGTLKDKFFDTGKAADSGKDRILYQENKGWIRYDADGKGGDDAVKVVRIEEKLDLSTGDFLVI